MLNVPPALALTPYAFLLLQPIPDLLHRQARSIHDCSLLPFSAFCCDQCTHHYDIELDCCQGGAFAQERYSINDGFGIGRP